MEVKLSSFYSDCDGCSLLKNYFVSVTLSISFKFFKKIKVNVFIAEIVGKSDEKENKLPIILQEISSLLKGDYSDSET